MKKSVFSRFQIAHGTVSCAFWVGMSLCHIFISQASEFPLPVSTLQTSSTLQGGDLNSNPENLEPTDFAFDNSPPLETWLDNLSFFGGIDGAKQPQDLGINALLGGRLSANCGIPLQQDWGLGLQAGVGYNFSQSAVAVLEKLDPATNGRNQLFTTVGLLQRHASGWQWALAHDFLFEDYYDNFHLGQWRGSLGYAWNPQNELGVWSTVKSYSDSGFAAGTPVQLQAMNQLNVYWRHDWETGIQTKFWVGVAQSHSEIVYVFPQNTRTPAVPVIGASLNAPLNDYLSIFGEANLIMPADSGTVDAYLGIAYYPRGGAKGANYLRFAPMLPVANNPSFAVDLNR